MHSIKDSLLVPIGLDEAWAFFASPANLKTLTPPHIGFQLLDGYEPGQEMYPGQIITYRVKPLLGIPMTWVSEITHIEEKKLFVDVQREGPYAYWHHQHFLEEKENGTLLRDVVHYKVPLGPLGLVANALMVSKMLDGIFKFRKEKMQELFGAPSL